MEDSKKQESKTPKRTRVGELRDPFFLGLIFDSNRNAFSRDAENL
jgi:hypothetical protein